MDHMKKWMALGGTDGMELLVFELLFGVLGKNYGIIVTSKKHRYTET